MSKKQRTLQIAGLILESEYDFNIPIPESIMQIYNAFIKNGQKLYLVGGAVRDAKLKKTPKDFDLATDAVPTRVQEILNSENIYNFPKGESFGVISAVIDKKEYEIATFRGEDYAGGDGRRPTSVFFSDMKTDALRRDLTINALFYDIGAHKIIDFVGGVEDIENNRVRAVGNPMDRISDDRLRAVRLLRFLHRLNSTIDQEHIDAIIHFNQLPGVSSERIREEFIKAIESAVNPEEFLKQYTELGLMPRTFQHLTVNKKFIPGLRNIPLIIANLLGHNKIDSIVKCLKLAKMTADEIKAIIFLLKVRDRFLNFDRLVFSPEIDGKWLESLTEERDLVLRNGLLTENDLIHWAQIVGINALIMNAFAKFKLIYNASNFPHLPEGKELGDEIKKNNAIHFLENL